MMSLLLSMIAGHAGAEGSAGAARSDDGVAMQFDIPAQPLQNALEAFGAASGFSGLYSTTSTDGHLSSPVQGRYSANAALHLLIGNAGLAVRYTARDAFILEPDSNSAPVPAPSQGTYFGLVQARVREAICGDARLMQDDFRLAMSFRIDAQGQLIRPLLLSSTGNGARDRTVIDLLNTVHIGSAPADPSQPFTMLVLPGTLRAGCAT